MLNRELAKRLVEKLTGSAGCHINIMDTGGTIIASSDEKRIGQFHDVAYRILQEEEDSIVCTGTDGQYPGVCPGINMAIIVDGKKEGVLGLTGEPENLSQIGRIMKLSIETMIKYERQQELLMRKKSEKERFINRLIYGEEREGEKQQQEAEQFGYRDKIPRAAVLCSCQKGEVPDILARLKQTEYHSAQDISFEVDDSHLIVYKALSEKGSRGINMWREEVTQYLSDVLPVEQGNRQLQKTDQRNPQEVTAFVGSVQQHFHQYRHGFAHCRWLEKFMAQSQTPPGRGQYGGGIYFFYDYADFYMRNLFPANELYRMYNAVVQQYPLKWRQGYMEVMDALMQGGYRLKDAADHLFIHKNTLQYRLNRIRETLDKNPFDNPGDRYFMEGLYMYLKSICGNGEPISVCDDETND